MLKHCLDLFTFYARKPSQKIINGSSILEILKKRRYRDPRSAKNRLAADDRGIYRNGILKCDLAC